MSRTRLISTLLLVLGLCATTPMAAMEPAEQRARDLWAPFDTPLHHSLIAALRSLPSDNGGSVRYVGPEFDPACDYIDLQTAIEQAPVGVELRLSRQGVYNASYVIQRSITLVGGFENCSAPTPVPSFRTMLDRQQAGGPVLRVVGFQSGTPRVVSLRNLVLRGGGSADSTMGGGLHLDGNTWLRLANSDVVGNRAQHGGGIRVIGGSWPVLLIEAHSRIGMPGQGNVASGHGGGIACSGLAVVLFDDAMIADNEAALTHGHGGGLHVRDQCHFFGFPGSYAFGGLVHGIGRNRAAFGGGVHVARQGKIVLFGQPGLYGLGNATTATLLVENDAAIGGGGLAEDVDSELILVDTIVQDNGNLMHSLLGGGLLAQDEARILFGRSTAADCSAQLLFSPQPCPRLRGNEAVAGGGMAAIHAGRIDVAGVHLRDNRAVSDGSVLYSGGGLGGRIEIVNSQISEHAGSAPLISLEHGQLQMHRSTIAGNSLSGPVFRLDFEASPFHPILIDLEGSLIWQPDSALVQGMNPDAHAILASCALLHDVGAVDAGAFVRSDDPLLLPAGTDGALRPGPGSPTIDLCPSAAVAIPVQRDLDGAPRQSLASLRACTPLDAGAFEHQDERLFGYDFESSAGC